MDSLEEKYNYIIITNNFLKNSVEELKEWRESQGFNIKVITNLRNAEEIRNFLKTKYIDWNIEYLLIVGSINTIPMKFCWLNIDHNNLKIFERFYAIPTDYYYAELTYDWDLDGDGYAGEYEEDIKNNTDILPELIVGRIPFDREIVESMVQGKTIVEHSNRVCARTHTFTMRSRDCARAPKR